MNRDRIRVGVANVVYTNRPSVVRKVLAQLTVEYGVDVWILVETKNVDVREILGAGWSVHQGRRWNLSRRNATVAWAQPTKGGRRRFILGTLPLGHAILTRWITRARLSFYGPWPASDWSPYVATDAIHIPPSRDNELVPTYARHILSHGRNRWKLWGGDRNAYDMRRAAQHYGMAYYQYGVMFVATNLEHGPLKVEHVNAFDHAVLFLDIEAPS